MPQHKEVHELQLLSPYATRRESELKQKTLMLGKTGQEEKGQQWVGCFNGIIDSMDVSMSKLWEVAKDREAWRAAVHEVARSQTQLSN